MAPPNVRSVLHDFQDDLLKCRQLLTSVRTAGLPFFQVELVAELSFLRMYVSWESFLEETFSRFLCGARGTSGSQAISCAKPRSIDHAKALLRGLERGGRFADWSRRDVVSTRANLFFRGGFPYLGPLNAAARDLDDMRAIRDCIAHRSRSAKDNLANIIHRRTGLALKFSPGRFLLRTATGTTSTHLDLFSNTLSLTANQITA